MGYPPVAWILRLVAGIATGLAGLFGRKRKCPPAKAPREELPSNSAEVKK